MLGHIVEWFYHDLAGLGCDPDGPGWRKIIIRPNPVRNLDWVRASYNSVHGRVETAWEKVGNELRLNIRIPANATATVIVPAKSVASVSESGHGLDGAQGVRVLRSKMGCVVLAVESGTYRFVARTDR